MMKLNMPEIRGKRLLLISHHNSYRIAPYIKAARNLGLEVSIASQGKHSLVTEIANGIHVNFDDLNEALNVILEENRNTPFAGILGSDDQTVELAAHVAKALKLPHNPPQAAQFSHRKDLARAQLALAGCPVPIHCLLDLNSPLQKQMAGLPWPCVLKPLNMSASRGVIRVNNEAEFVTACERLRPILATAQGEFEQHHVLIEDYIDGIEIAYEGFLYQGELNTITIFDKPDPLVGPYFEETIYVTPSALSQALQKTLKDVLQKACDAYGLTTGAIHAECRIDMDNNIWILEIASRTIGGDCARILDNDNFGIEELAILLAINQPVEAVLPDIARGVMMIPIKQKGLLKRVEGLLQANKVDHIDKIDIIISEGHELIPLPEGNQYLGYIFAHADSKEKVTAAIREAYAQLKFVTTPVFKINS
jgi:carbamoylphosphate synthase large subunit